MNNILQYPEQEINNNNSTQLHVWNNAAFDGGEDLSMHTSWSSDCAKENLSPIALNSSRTSFTKLKNRYEKIIDEEIAEIEGQIKRLTLRLEALRLEKAERRIAKKRVSVDGRVLAAKFMEPKRNSGGVKKKVEEATPKRNVLVPKRMGKSVRKRGEQEDAVVQPRNLFSEVERSVPVSSSKKGLKPGRVVASRYSQGIGNSGAGSDVRKRSLPENNRVRSEVRVKKRWEIPAEGTVNGGAVLLPKIRNLRCVNESPRDSGGLALG